MSVVIEVEKLSKKYRIRHHNAGKYLTLRDSLDAKFKHLKRRCFGMERGQGDAYASEDIWALKDVSFQIQEGERVGIIGRNGAGKSTLLKILSRIVEPTSGRARIKGRLASLLEVGTGFHPELTGRENIFLNGAVLGMHTSEIRRRFDEIVSFAEVEKFLDTPVKRYSTGMYMRLAFSVAAHLDPEILLVDEVLAVGDMEFQRKCLARVDQLGRSGKTIMVVSHNMDVIRKHCSLAICLEAGLVKQAGECATVLKQYASPLQESVKVYESGPVRLVTVEQRGSQLFICLDFSVEKPLVMPKFGFVVSDMMSFPLFGCNPVVAGVPPLPRPMSAGRVVAVISEPKLMNGSYLLSVWFGDGREDFFMDRHCIGFNICGMTEQGQQPPEVVGAIAPQCLWQFIPRED